LRTFNAAGKYLIRTSGGGRKEFFKKKGMRKSNAQRLARKEHQKPQNIAGYASSKKIRKI